MFSKSQKIFFICGILLILFVCIQQTEQMTISPPPFDEDISTETSSEYSHESDEHQQRKRATDNSGNSESLLPRAAIPGLPDPATIIKIAELIQSVSDQIVPIIVEGIASPAELLNKQISKNFQMLSKFKNRLELLSGEWKPK